MSNNNRWNKLFKIKTNEWIKQANLKFNNKFDYSKVELVNSDTRVTIICPEHGEFKMIKRTHLNSEYGCIECMKIGKELKHQQRYVIDIEEWKKRCNLKFNNKFDYSKVESKKVTDKIIIICPDHGEIESTREYHEVSATGCKYCGGSAKLSTSEFIKKCEEIYPNRFVYNNVDYKNIDSPVIITCKIHGDFETLPNNFIRRIYGKYIGCSKCNELKGDADCKLYYIKLKNQNLWKIGVTRNTVEYRFGPNIKYFDIKTLKYFNCNSYESAIKYEEMILTHFKSHINEDINILGNSGGYSEVIKIDPINYIKLIYSKYNKFYNFLNNLDIEYEIIKHEFLNLFKINSIIFNYVVCNEKIHSVNFYNILSQQYGDTKIITLYEHTSNEKNLNIINNALQLNTNKIYARKCEVKEITKQQTQDFLNKYHIQGYRIDSFRLGLFHNNELIQVMTFGKSMFIKDSNYIEIYRLVSKSNLTVVGGASKLLNYFEQNFSNDYTHIVSYADGSFSNGNVYYKLGFDFSHETDNGYSYFHPDFKIHLSRYKSTKLNLKEYFAKGLYNIKSFDSNKTELENMKNNGYIKIFHAKQLAFIKEIR